MKPQLTRLEATIPFLIAGVSGVLLACFWLFRPFGDFDFWIIGILGTVLIFDLVAARRAVIHDTEVV